MTLRARTCAQKGYGELVIERDLAEFRASKLLAALIRAEADLRKIVADGSLDPRPALDRVQAALERDRKRG